MLENNTFVKTLSDFLKSNSITHIFCSNKFCAYLKLECNDFFIHTIEDVRSMTYVACGMCAAIKKPTVIVVDGDNESRSLFSGMTEAFYRDLPIIAVIISNYNQLNYKKGMNDCAANFYSIRDVDSKKMLDRCFEGIKKNVLVSSKPILINYISDKNGLNPKIEASSSKDKISNILSVFETLIDSDDYLFIADDIIYNNTTLKLKHIYETNSETSSNDGIISTVFGAALSKIHKNYYCILSYKDFIHDINSLANRHFPNNIVIVILSNCQHKTISDYCNSLGINYAFSHDLTSLAKNKVDGKASVIELNIIR